MLVRPSAALFVIMGVKNIKETEDRGSTTLQCNFRWILFSIAVRSSKVYWFFEST